MGAGPTYAQRNKKKRKKRQTDCVQHINRKEREKGREKERERERHSQNDRGNMSNTRAQQVHGEQEQEPRTGLKPSGDGERGQICRGNKKQDKIRNG